MNTNAIYKSLIYFVSGNKMLLAAENQTLFRVYYSTLYIYHIRYNKVTKSKIPIIVNKEAEGITINCNIYLIGGGFPASNTNIAITLYSSAFSRKEPMPAKQYGIALTKYTSTIYTIGGTNSVSTMNNVFSYSVLEDRWKICTPLPSGVAYACACIVNKIIYSIGGLKHNEIFYTPLNANKWEVFHLSETMCFMKSVVVDSNILIIGNKKACIIELKPNGSHLSEKSISLRYKFNKLVSPIIKNNQNMYFISQDGFIFSYNHKCNDLKRIANCEE